MEFYELFFMVASAAAAVAAVYIEMRTRRDDNTRDADRALEIKHLDNEIEKLDMRLSGLELAV